MKPKLGALAPLLFLLLMALPCHPRVYKVGYICTTHSQDGRRQGLMISGAITAAVNYINQNETILGNDTVEMIWRNDGAQPLLATKYTMDLYHSNVSVIIGPEDNCRIPSVIATASEIPMMSHMCVDSGIDPNATFVRMVPSEIYAIKSLEALLAHFKLRQLTVIYDVKKALFVENIKSELMKKNLTVLEHSYMNKGVCCEVTPSCCDKLFYEELRATMEKTRIYVFVGSLKDLNVYLLSMSFLGLMKHAEHYVIYVAEDYSMNIEELNTEFPTHTKQYHFGLNLALRNMFALLPKGPRYDMGKTFEDQIRHYNSEPPFNFTKPIQPVHISVYAYYLYDSLLLWAKAATALLAEKQNLTGNNIIAKIREKWETYDSSSGNTLTFMKDGTVSGGYVLVRYNLNGSDIRSESGHFEVVGDFEQDGNKTSLNLLNGHAFEEIRDEPLCGFEGKKCPNLIANIRKWVAGVLLGFLMIVALCAIFVYRNWQYEQEIAGLLWMIDISDLQECTNTALSAVSKISIVSQCSKDTHQRLLSRSVQMCNYRGALVVIKKLQRGRKGVGDIPRRLKKEMKLMREMHHNNVNPFIGAYLMQPSLIYFCSEFCSKGCLQDILENEDVKLDNMFIASLVMDLVKGLEYLHQSVLRVHGNLKSTNCLISNKWTLQVSDFGLSEVRYHTEEADKANDEIQYYKNLVWRSPESLRSRLKSIDLAPTQKDDVYSFSIILHEIMSRQGVWGSIRLINQIEPKEIVTKLCTVPFSEKELFRPSLDDIQCQDYVVDVITDCWAEKPQDRPDITDVAVRLKRMRHGMKANIVDNMVMMLETYANNLENLVQERTCLLEEEKKKTEVLLHRMLPKSVALQLMRGECVVPVSYDAVTIYFSDIVGFTEMSATSTPMEVVGFLNDLYTVFDSIIGNYDVYKVETIGDAYMVVSGLPETNGVLHASEISLMALELLDAVKAFRIRHKPNQSLKLRIGLHTGPVVAGVVGLTMPRYCLFGDTVNTASRMESNGEALKIHVSSHTKQVLDSIGGFILECRGLVKMKGKGDQTTFWLQGHTDGISRRRDQSSIPLPTPLFKGALQSDERTNRRSSLIPKVDSTDSTTALLPNGGANAQKITRFHPSANMLHKRYESRSSVDDLLA